MQMKYNNDMNLFKIILDSGNDLSLPAISAVMYKKLKDSKIIPDKLSLKRTSCSIKGADNSPLSVLGKLNYPLIFTHPSNHNLELKFNQFYVIEGLSNSINLGKPVLKQIDTVWDFKSPTISIKIFRYHYQIKRKKEIQEISIKLSNLSRLIKRYVFMLNPHLIYRQDLQ